MPRYIRESSLWERPHCRGHTDRKSYGNSVVVKWLRVVMNDGVFLKSEHFVSKSARAMGTTNKIYLWSCDIHLLQYSTCLFSIWEPIKHTFEDEVLVVCHDAQWSAPQRFGPHVVTSAHDSHCYSFLTWVLWSNMISSMSFDIKQTL